MNSLYALFRSAAGVSTDTRRIVPGSIFFALHGATFDGNRFAAEALARGAVHAVVDDPAAAGPRTTLVADTLAALQELARLHRRTLGIPILAVAGSNGKTTTKELVGRVLAERYRLYATHGNLNNHIGVPLTLLAMTEQTQFGVVEMGASACGEIARLCAIAEPDYGLLTNIGRSHLEGFGGVEGIRRGKGELYDYLAARGGTAFLREEDAVLGAIAAERPALRVVRYSERLAEGIESALEGDYNRYNIAAAAAVGRHFDVPEEAVRRAIGSYVPDNNRSQRIESARNTLIVDCYNANPSSMGAAIAHILAEPLGARRHRVLILGDMLELGVWSEEEHRTVLRQAAADPAVELRLVGKAFRKALDKEIQEAQEVQAMQKRFGEAVRADRRTEDAAGGGGAGCAESDRCAAEARFGGRIRCYDSCDALRAELAEDPIEDALVLLKGSHGIGLERAVELL